MLRFQHVLVPTDGGPAADVAFGHAVRLAEATGAELHLLHVVVGMPGIDGPSVGMPAPAPGLRTTTATTTADSAAAGILAYAEDHGIDLIVMGTHGRRGLRHIALGSVAERVTRQAECPVLTVGTDCADRACAARSTPRPVRRLLVPLDFSPESEAALRVADSLAELFGATVDVLHAVHVPALPDVYLLGVEWTAPRLVDRTRAALRRLLARHVDPARQGAVLVVVDAPAAAVLDAARERKTDLVVMTTHGLTGLKRFALGSVAERVVQRAPCPVYMVRKGAEPQARTTARAAAHAEPSLAS